MLVLAAAAVAEIFALRLDTVFRRLDDVEEVGASETFLHLGDLGLNRLALDHQRHEHDKPIHAPDAFAAEGYIVDAHRDPLADLRPGDFLFSGCGCSVAQNSFALGQAIWARPRPGHVTRTAGLAKGCCEKSDLLFVVLLVVLAQQIVAEVVLQVARNTVDVVGAVL